MEKSKSNSDFIFLKLFLSYLILTALGSQYSAHLVEAKDSVLSINQLQDLSRNLENKLSKLHGTHTQMELLPERDSRLAVEQVNPESLVRVMSKKISILFKKKHQLLNNIVNTLEESSKNYGWKDNLRRNFSNIVLLNSSTEEAYKNNSGIYEESFGVNVNRSLTGVHVPVEIYEGYPEIINGIHWSAAVDKTFQRNLIEDPSLSWQFFTAQAGFMRIYPATFSWYIPPPYNEVDLFDGKRRSWFLEASVSPKDVIVLLDRSGSVHGQTFSIMKFAVEMLLSTLGENDYVNVAAFNETTLWVSQIAHEQDDTEDADCLHYSQDLIQANNINKKALIDDMHTVKDMGLSNYTDAVNFAYEIFKKRAEKEERGANCHKLVMLFTDGGTDWPGTVLKNYINDTLTSDVKIFTFAIGPHPIPVAVLRKMSCMTGGKLSVITTSSGVRTKMQESYLDTLSEPVAQAGNHELHYTSAYTSAVTGNLTITMSLPVFNLSSSMTSDRTFAGVAGIDIPCRQLENISPRLSLGPIGYSFIVNRNGFLSLHPRLQSQMSYLQDPPHIDLLDMELNAEELVLTRKQMVDQLEGSNQMSGKLLLDMKHIYTNRRLQFTYTLIEDSPFSLGMFTLVNSKYFNVMSDGDLNKLNVNNTLLAPWNFCGSQPYEGDATLLKRWIAKAEVNCDNDLLRGLSWANDWTEAIRETWLTDTRKNKDIYSKSVFTQFGFATVVKSSTDEEEVNDIKENNNGYAWRNPNENPALKSATVSDKLALFPHAEGTYLSRPAKVNSLVAAAVGVNVSSELIGIQLEEAVKELRLDGKHNLILVDEAAYIIAASFSKKMSGLFLGSYSSLLLEKLVEAGIYKYENVTDFFATCETEKAPPTEISAGSHMELFIKPFKFLSASVLKMVYLFESLQYLALYGFGSLLNSQTAEAGKRMRRVDACFMQHQVYYFTNKMQFSGNITCLEDSSQVLVTRLRKTNTILIHFDDNLATLECDAPQHHSFDQPEAASEVNAKLYACRKPRYINPKTTCMTSERDKCVGASGRISPIVMVLIIMLKFLHSFD